MTWPTAFGSCAVITKFAQAIVTTTNRAATQIQMALTSPSRNAYYYTHQNPRSAHRAKLWIGRKRAQCNFAYSYNFAVYNILSLTQRIIVLRRFTIQRNKALLIGSATVIRHFYITYIAFLKLGKICQNYTPRTLVEL